MEFYANNSAGTVKYTLNTVDYTVPTKCIDVWVDGVRIGENIKANESTTDELPVGDALSGILFNSTGVTTVNQGMVLSNINASFGEVAPLPVSLSSFTAKSQNDAVKLNWTTLSEQSNSHFEILRASGNSDFNLLDRVTGSGNSTEVRTYSYTDYAPKSGVNYYKLKQVDFDGTAKESGIQSVKTDLSVNSFHIAKLANEEFYAIIKSDVSIDGIIRISDASGKVVFSKKIVDNSFGSVNVKLTSLSMPGVYVVSFTNKGKTQVSKFVN